MAGFLAGYSRQFMMAVALWPFASVVLTLPLLAYLYHRDGRLRPWPALGAYLSVLYLLALACFTLYPLPSGTTGLGLTYGIAPQLDPLAFVGDIRKDGLKAVLQIVANVEFFVPLGLIVGRGLRRGLATTLLVGLAVSLLIETAQLTGLFGIYPYAYRTFDVDDLAWNTAGSLVGWLLCRASMRVLPPTQGPDEREVTTAPGLLRRLVAFGLDMALASGATLALASSALLWLAVQGAGGFGAARVLTGLLSVTLAPLMGSGALTGGMVGLLLASPLVSLIIFEGVVPWVRGGRTVGGDFVRMTFETRERHGARRLAFYTLRLLTLVVSLACAPVAVPVLAVFWLCERRMPYDLV